MTRPCSSRVRAPGSAQRWRARSVRRARGSRCTSTRTKMPRARWRRRSAAAGRTALVRGDLSKRGEAKRVVEEAARGLGGLDILINNAGGLGERRPIADVDDALFDFVYDLNVRSVIAATQAAIPHFEKGGGGNVINVGSIAGIDGGGAGASVYSTRQSGRAQHHASPGPRSREEEDPREHGGARRHRHAFSCAHAAGAAGGHANAAPLGRIGEAQDCVGAFLFLASDDSRATSPGRSFTSTAGCTCHDGPRVHRRRLGHEQPASAAVRGRWRRARFARRTGRRRFARPLRRGVRRIDRRLARSGGLPALLCGMAGSTFGWVEAPYLTCPEDLDSAAASLTGARADVHIVPGMRCANPLGAPDVMRGEETQLLGALALHPALGDRPPSGVHAGHAYQMGRVARRHRARVPDRTHRRNLRACCAITACWCATAIRRSPITAARVRTRSRRSGQTCRRAAAAPAVPEPQPAARQTTGAEGAASWTSGLLIGTDCAGALPLFEKTEAAVYIVATDHLAGLYGAALARLGRPGIRVAGEDAAFAGLARIHAARAGAKEHP